MVDPNCDRRGRRGSLGQDEKGAVFLTHISNACTTGVFIRHIFIAHPLLTTARSFCYKKLL